MTPDLTQSQILQHLEESHLDQATRNDPQHLDQLLADDFREFGASGRIFSKPEIIAQIKESGQDWHYQISDYACCELGLDTVLATYHLTILSPKGERLRTSNRASIWRRSSGIWKLFFHQGTSRPMLD